MLRNLYFVIFQGGGEEAGSGSPAPHPLAVDARKRKSALLLCDMVAYAHIRKVLRASTLYRLVLSANNLDPDQARLNIQDPNCLIH